MSETMETSSETAPDSEDAAERPPEWNLSDLYDGPDSADLEADFLWAEKESRTFRDRYEGCLADLDGAALGAAIAHYETIGERLQKALSYAHLRFAENVADGDSGRFFQGIQERVTVISTGTIWPSFVRWADSMVKVPCSRISSHAEGHISYVKFGLTSGTPSESISSSV